MVDTLFTLPIISTQRIFFYALSRFSSRLRMQKGECFGIGA